MAKTIKPKPAKIPSQAARKSTSKDNSKIETLRPHKEEGDGEFLTTNQGVRINDSQNSLKSGERGSTLLEDFILREKITHECIPERIVHARGSAVHGTFKLYRSV